MSDNLYNALYESWQRMEQSSVFLTEAKRKYPHLSEEVLLENKQVIDNIQSLSVSARDIMNAYQISFAQARQMKKSYDAFAIAEYYARTENDVDVFAESVERSCKLILELDTSTVGDQTLKPGFKYDPAQGKAAVDAEKAAAAAAAQPAKKGLWAKTKDMFGKGKDFLVKSKAFLSKAGAVIKNIATSGSTYKVLAIGAAMVILGVIAGSLGPAAAAGFAALKGILAGYSIFKGSKELMKTSEFAQGKKGIEGVKEWIKNSKDPKNAARIILAISQVALGAWGGSTAIGQAMQNIATMDAMKMYNPDGGTDVVASAKPVAPAAPATPAPAPADPEAPAAAAPDLSKYANYGASKAEALQSSLQQAAQSGDGAAFKGIVDKFAEGVGQALKDGKLSEDQAKEILKGFAKEVQSNNGGLSFNKIFDSLLSAAKMK